MSSKINAYHVYEHILRKFIGKYRDKFVEF